MEIITNNVPRDIIWGYEVSEKDRKEFDYIDWDAVDEGREAIQFARYKGEFYDLNDMEGGWGTQFPEVFKGWDNYRSDSFFSGILVKYVDDEQVIMGRYYS